MAVDTRNERAAVVSLANPFMLPPALPDGSAERYGLAHLFYNEAGAPAPGAARQGNPFIASPGMMMNR